VEGLRALIAADYINHNPYVSPAPGPDSALSFFTAWLEAFPDAHVICEDTIGVGSATTGSVVGRFTYMGTFTQQIFGIPPTGKRVVMRSIDIWRVDEGRFVEHWDELNTADWFAQLQGADAQPRTGATTL
jgi:predicted SnoaL-like aldol condensation-catalyzing enzyme